MTILKKENLGKMNIFKIYIENLKNKKEAVDQAVTGKKSAHQNYKHYLSLIMEESSVDENGKCVTGIWRNEDKYVSPTDDAGDRLMKNYSCVHRFQTLKYVPERGTTTEYGWTVECTYFNCAEPCEQTDCKLHKKYLNYNAAVAEYNNAQVLLSATRKNLAKAVFAIK